MNNSIYQAQILIQRWLSHFEKKSYKSIKDACEYLNTSMHLGIWGNPMWFLFYPLMRSGIVDSIGNDYYAVTPSVVLDFDTHLYELNGMKQSEGLIVGYNYIDRKNIRTYHNVVKLSTLAILRSFPTVESIVFKWSNSTQDESILNYHDKHNRAGIAELKNGTTRYFVIPSSCILKEIPARCINPDAYNIGICYERVINKKVNGVYSHKLRQLKMSSFGIPFILYRTLMLDGLSERQFPIEYNGNVVFPNISSSVVKELNRILCNSISYE